MRIFEKGMRIAEVTLDAAVKINELYKMMSVSKQLQWMLIYMLFHVQSNDVSAAGKHSFILWLHHQVVQCRPA